MDMRNSQRLFVSRPSSIPGRSPLTLLLALLVLALSVLVGCESSKGRPSMETGSASKTVSLNGAGATFPFPLYSKWMSEYNKINPDVRINYQSIGSGGGIRQVTAGTVDFGASDAPMDADSQAKAGGTIDHIPTTLGAVAVSYNLAGIVGLKLDGDTLTQIFQGKIVRWNDAKLAAINPEAKLPDQAITVIYRSDGSGTTAVFTDYLGTVSPAWKAEVGVGKSVRWPVGLGAKGNEGVTGQLKVSPGSIGYIEIAYALQNKLSIAAIKNKSGQFVLPDVAAVTAAASEVSLSDALTASIVDAAGPGAYPISSFTYLLVHRDAKDRRKGEALARFLWWALHDGQKFSSALHYAPLPASVTAKVESRLRSLTAGGQVLLSGT
jgi:phosphate transport system substrate-binding protein